MKKVYIIFLFIASMTFISCSQSTNETFVQADNNTLMVELMENSELIFAGKTITFDEFSKLATDRIKSAMDKGIERSEITILISAAKDVDMGLVTDFQNLLRELQIRKIKYSTKAES